jgi:tetratricopeptide (TPR) repeat protein
VGRTAQALGQWEEARRVYTEGLEIAQRLLARVGETPEALRDVSVALNNVGRTAEALGQWEEARRVYGDGLAVAAPLSAALPDRPEYAGLADHFRRRLKALASHSREPEAQASADPD